LLLAACSPGPRASSGPPTSPQPSVSAERVISSLCADLQGLVLPTGQDVAINSEPLGLDAELLREAGEVALAHEVDDLYAELSQPGVEVAVFLVDAITDAARRAIGERLRSAQGIARVDFETREEAAERFREMFKKFPVFLENVDVRILPASWRGFAPDQDVSGFAHEVRGMPGVRSVDITPIGFSEVFGELFGLHDRVCQGSGSTTTESPPG
jgi:hypothetical protein